MSVPFVGEIRMFGFGRTPVGWQACDGSLLQISEYETLFVLLGTTYGGDGQNTFGVPDLRGRVPIHQGQGTGLTNRPLGQRGGTETVALLEAHLPAHTHTMMATSAAATSNVPSGLLPAAVGGDVFYATDLTGATAVTMAATATTLAGGGQAHDNLMPTLTVQYCIATVGEFPQQS